MDYTKSYIWISHLADNGLYFLLPTFPDSISESLPVSWSQTSILSRSAPIQTYNSSGPRTLTITLNLHRDMFYDLNLNNASLSNYKDTLLTKSEDTVGLLINALQSVSVPAYSTEELLANRLPVVKLCYADEFYIQGIITGDISTTYSLPIIEYDSKNHYAAVEVQFTITEVYPFSSQNIYELGSYRNIIKHDFVLNLTSLGGMNYSQTTLSLDTADSSRSSRTQEKVEFTTGFKDISSYANSKGILLNLVTTIKSIFDVEEEEEEKEEKEVSPAILKVDGDILNNYILENEETRGYFLNVDYSEGKNIFPAVWTLSGSVLPDGAAFAWGCMLMYGRRLAKVEDTSDWYSTFKSQLKSGTYYGDTIVPKNGDILCYSGNTGGLLAVILANNAPSILMTDSAAQDNKYWLTIGYSIKGNTYAAQQATIYLSSKPSEALMNRWTPSLPTGFTTYTFEGFLRP